MVISRSGSRGPRPAPRGNSSTPPSASTPSEFALPCPACCPSNHHGIIWHQAAQRGRGRAKWYGAHAQQTRGSLPGPMLPPLGGCDFLLRLSKSDSGGAQSHRENKNNNRSSNLPLVRELPRLCRSHGPRSGSKGCRPKARHRVVLGIRGDNRDVWTLDRLVDCTRPHPQPTRPSIAPQAFPTHPPPTTDVS